MKQKLFLTLLALLTLSGSRAWADVTVTIAQHPDTNGEFATAAATTDYYTTWTSKEASGLAGLTITTGGNLGMCYQDVSSASGYGYLLALKTTSITTAEALTVTAPTGYYIKGYSMTTRLYSSTDNKYAVTNCAGTETEVTASTSNTTFSETNLCSNTFTLYVKDARGSSSLSTYYLCVTAFTVTLAEVPTYDASYTSIPLNSTTGTLGHTCSNSSTWYCKWTSDQTAPNNLTLTTAGYHNMQQTTSNINIHSANGSSFSYTLTAPTGYLIAGYTISMSAGAAGSYLTPSGCARTLIGTDSSNPTVIYVTGLATSSTTFTRTGTSTDGYATFTVYLLPSYDITYKLPGTSQSDVVVPQLAGSAISAPSAWAHDGVTFSYYTTYNEGTGAFSDAISTAPSSAQTVYVDYTYSLSSLISPSTSNFAWYRLAALSNGVYYDLYYNGSAPYPFKAQSAFDGSDGYFWAFVGNPFDGFAIYNKALSNSYTLYASSFGNGVAPSMSNENSSSWYIKINGEHIGFECVGTDNSYRYLNDHGGGASALKFYSGYTPIQYTHIDDVDYSGLYTANIAPYITYAGDGYFKISSSDASTLSSEYTTANSDSKITLSEYSSLVTSLHNKINYPATGYYRLKSVSAETYLQAESASQLTVGSSTAASTIAYLTGSNGSYTIQMQGAYVRPQSNNSAAILGASQTLTLSSPLNASNEVVPGKVTVFGGQSATDYLRVNEGNVVGLATGNSPNNNTAAYWTLEDATSFTGTLTNANDNTGAGHSYASLCVPFAISGLTGAEAYAPTRSGNMLDLGEGASTVVAGTPVILVGASGAGSYTATINTGSAPVTSPATTNDLTGTFTGTSLDCTANYVLGFDVDNSNRIGFYHVTDGSSFALSANRAYLVSDGGGEEVKGFALNFDTATGISEVVNGNTVNVQCYDLSGRRVSRPTRGLYIAGGRKVVVK